MGYERLEIGRCQHIKTNGTQCGSPALRDEKLCYHHRENKPEQIKVKGDDGKTSALLVPLWEDAASIQIMVRKVAILLLEGKIDVKKAGQVLRALQIASSNLKRMEEEKPRPVQVVVDTDKVAETEIDMTPWTFRSRGWEFEDVAVGFRGALAARLKREIGSLQGTLESNQREARRIAKEIRSQLSQEPKIEYDRLRHTAEILADKVDRGLGNEDWI